MAISMDGIRLIFCLVIQVIWLKGVFTDESKGDGPKCSLIEISNTWLHRELEGVYRLKAPASYNCNGKPVYKLEDKEYYLFYIIQGSWQGWMIGKYECVNKGYLSVGDTAKYPEDIQKQWEEYNSQKWLFNKDIISGCHQPGVTRPPRMKTKPPKVRNETESTGNVTTSAVQEHGSFWSSIMSDRTMSLVIFVAVPIGCLVILALLVILCILAGSHKSFLKRLAKEEKHEVKYDGKQVKITPKPQNGTQPEETDSVFEVLEDPEDASSVANTTPPTERAKRENKIP